MSQWSGGFVFAVERAGGSFNRKMGTVSYPEETVHASRVIPAWGSQAQEQVEGLLLSTGDFLYFEEYSGFWQAQFTPETNQEFSFRH